MSLFLSLKIKVIRCNKKNQTTNHKTTIKLFTNQIAVVQLSYQWNAKLVLPPMAVVLLVVR